MGWRGAVPSKSAAYGTPAAGAPPPEEGVAAHPSRGIGGVLGVGELEGHRLVSNNSIWRNFPNVRNRRWSAGNIVLLGDALFSHALHLAAQFPTTAVCSAVSASTRRVCSGEIIQTLRRGTTAVSREDYYRVIDLKTQHIGPEELLVAGKIEFDRSLSNAEISEAIDTVESAIRAAVPLTMQIYLEPDLFDPHHVETPDLPSTH